MSKVDMLKLYGFCPIVHSFKEAPAVDSGKRRPWCMSIRAHHVLGAIIGICGFALMISLSPQGDSFTWVTYYFANKPALVGERCSQTTSEGTPLSPWCIAETEVTLTRWTLPPNHGLPDNTLVWLCLILKAVIFCMLGGLFGITVFNTVEGLRWAQRPMKILDFILMRWIHKRQFSTAQLQAWSMARASVLHNDVRFLFVGPLRASGHVLADPLRGPYHRCYAQRNHLKTLVEMKEASLLEAVGPDLDYVRSFLDVMVKRLSSGDQDVLHALESCAAEDLAGQLLHLRSCSRRKDLV
ncbi:unnamed protein product [Symbiodinium sp. CCMP2456]|nr:unnamed protein product [Symbiodinium sp. CCMP2456]